VNPNFGLLEVLKVHPKGRDHLGYLGIDMKIMLKWI